MDGYTPVEMDLREALGLPYATGRDDTPQDQPATQTEATVAA